MAMYLFSSKQAKTFDLPPIEEIIMYCWCVHAFVARISS